MKPRICFSVSSHGLGHLSQAAAVANHLLRTHSKAEILVRSEFSGQILRQWIGHENLECTYAKDDIGVTMLDATQIDYPATRKAYQVFHENLEQRVTELSSWLEEKDIDVLVSDIGYLPLKAAQELGIPNAAMCSLNWFEVLAAHESAFGATAYLESIKNTYRKADVFIRPSPSMPMAYLENAIDVPPIGREGVNRRHALNQRMGLNTDAILVLVGFGGLEKNIPTANLPTRIHDRPVMYVLPDKTAAADLPNVRQSDCQISYPDLVSSVDIVFTKPGYGIFVESAAAGVPIAYIPRTDWPDVNSVLTWMNRVSKAVQVDPHHDDRASIESAFGELVRFGKARPVVPNGAVEAVKQITAIMA